MEIIKKNCELINAIVLALLLTILFCGVTFGQTRWYYYSDGASTESGSCPNCADGSYCTTPTKTSDPIEPEAIGDSISKSIDKIGDNFVNKTGEIMTDAKKDLFDYLRELSTKIALVVGGLITSLISAGYFLGKMIDKLMMKFNWK